MIPFNQTKIVCTIGPATESKKMMKKLVLAGMDVMRMNFSHSSYDDHLQRLNTLKELNEELGTHVASLLDTKGPEIRTHGFEGGKATVKRGDAITIHMNQILGNHERFSVTYPELYKDIEIGTNLIVDDGYLILRVEAIEEKTKTIRTISLGNHTMKDRRGINVPGVKLNLDFISEKDDADIKWGCEHKVDFIAASFVRRKEDVLAIRELLEKHCATDIRIIAKIENQEGVNNLGEITDVADGVMIARGDLGVEVPPEEVPVIQKNIIEMCHQKGKVSITATQMLESMQDSPRPTRAEVSDVANAILDGADAIMLSGESAIGQYPIESVEVMQSIAKRMEKEIRRNDFIVRASKNAKQKDIASNIAMSVAHTVLQGQANLVVAPTMSGNTARLLSKFRPNTMVLALVPTATLARSLALNSCINAIKFDFSTDTEALVQASIDYIKETGLVNSGDRVVITGGFPIGTKTNSLRILDID